MMTDHFVRVRGLPVDHEPLFGEALTELAGRRQKNILLSTYYDSKQTFKDLGISIPPNLKNVEAALGWPSRAVQALARKHKFEGFSLDGETDPFSMGDLFAANDFELTFMQAVTSAYKHSCSFLLVTQGDTSAGEPPVLVSARGADSVGALWDSRRDQIKAAVVELDTDEAGQINEALFLAPGHWYVLYLDAGEWRVADSSANPAGINRPMIEALRYDPQLNRPFGRSRITREVRYLTDAAVRAMVRAEVSAEFFTAPQRYVLGADEEAFKDTDRWSAITGRILALSNNEEGDKPSIGQFPAQSPDQLWSTYRQLAQSFSAATNIPQNQVGLFADNPSSAEAMQAADAALAEDAEYQWKVFRPALLRTKANILGLMGEAIPDDFYRVRVNWEKARYVSPQASSDWAIKAVNADPTLQGSAVVRRRLGLSEGELEELRSDERRVGVLDQLANLPDPTATATGAVGE